VLTAPTKSSLHRLPYNWLSSSIRESKLLYDWRFRLGEEPLGTHDQHSFQLNTCGYSSYLTSSLMSGWVSRLQLLLVLASAVILGPQSRGTHDIFYCVEFETPPTWRVRSPYLYPPGTGCCHLYPQVLGSLFVASYDSQDYGGGIRTRLHRGWRSSKSESYITTDGQSASLSWNKAPIRSLRPDFYYCQTVAGLLM
jgi:hypothetical protein